MGIGAFPKNKFLETKEVNPCWSDWICFCEVVKEKKEQIKPRTLRRYFNLLVDKDDYAKSDKAQLLRHLETLLIAPLKR